MVQQRYLGRWLAVVLFACALSACAAGGGLVDHTFAFDALMDSPGITVLDFRYGDGKGPGMSNQEQLRAVGKSVQRTGTSGFMPRGDSLYVKWRINVTNEVLEDTVDLRQRLPRDLEDQTVYFMIKERQLIVFLISPERRPPNMQPNGPDGYRHLKVITIYPDQRAR